MAIVMAARTASYVAVGLVAGAVVDRTDARRLMIGTDVVRALAFLALPVLHALGMLEMFSLLLLVIAAAVAGVFFETAHAVLVKDLLDPKDLVRGNARLELSNQLSLFVGPALGGLMAATVGVSWALVLDGGSFLVSAAALLALMPQRPGGSQPGGYRRTVRRDIADGLRYMRRQPTVLALALLLASVNFLLASETLLVYHMREGLDLPGREVGLILAAGGMGGVLGSWAAGWLSSKARRETIITGGIVVLGGGLVLFAITPNALILAIGNALFGAAAVTANVTICSLRQAIVPRELLGRVTSSTRVIAFASNPLGAIAAGVLASMAGNDARPGFVAAGVLAVAVAVLAWSSRFLADIGVRQAVQVVRPEPELEVPVG